MRTRRPFSRTAPSGVTSTSIGSLPGRALPVPAPVFFFLRRGWESDGRRRTWNMMEPSHTSSYNMMRKENCFKLKKYGIRKTYLDKLRYYFNFWDTCNHLKCLMYCTQFSFVHLTMQVKPQGRTSMLYCNRVHKL